MGTAESRSLCLCIAPTGRLATLLTVLTLQQRHLDWPPVTMKGKRKKRWGVMEKARRQGGVRRRRAQRRLLLRSFPQRPPQLAAHAATLTDPHKPAQSTGGQESPPLTPPHALHRHLSCPAANGLTGAPSRRRLLPSPLSPAQTSLPPPPPRHLFPLLSTAPAPRTETGSSTRASAPRSHLWDLATSTHCSTPTSRTWEVNQAGMEEEELLRSTDALGWRRSTAGASRR